MESMIEIVRDRARNVKRWRDGPMARRLATSGQPDALDTAGTG